MTLPPLVFEQAETGQVVHGGPVSWLPVLHRECRVLPAVWPSARWEPC
jgi:hypothetical protein